MGFGNTQVDTAVMDRAKEQEDQRRNRKVWLPPGYYCMAITEVNIQTSKASQDMAILKLAPCAEDRECSSAVLSKELPIFIMGQGIGDEEKFREHLRKNNKDLKKLGREPTPAELSAAVTGVLSGAYNRNANYAFGIWGYDEFTDVPRFDRETKTRLDSAGNEYTKAESDQLYAAQKLEAYTRLDDALGGKEELANRIVYAMVTDETREEDSDEPKSSRIYYLKPELGYDKQGNPEELVPVEEWCGGE